MQHLADQLGSHRLVLDGELVCVGPDGKPDFGALRTELGANRAPGRPEVISR
jgi:ATP-dependent DNA ligase